MHSLPRTPSLGQWHTSATSARDLSCFHCRPAGCSQCSYEFGSSLSSAVPTASLPKRKATTFIGDDDTVWRVAPRLVAWTRLRRLHEITVQSNLQPSGQRARRHTIERRNEPHPAAGTPGFTGGWWLHSIWTRNEFDKTKLVTKSHKQQPLCSATRQPAVGALLTQQPPKQPAMEQATTFTLHATTCCAISTNRSTKTCCDNSLHHKIGRDSARFPKNFGANVGLDADTRPRPNVLSQFLWPKSPDTMECVGLSAVATVRS